MRLTLRKFWLLHWVTTATCLFIYTTYSSLHTLVEARCVALPTNGLTTAALQPLSLSLGLQLSLIETLFTSSSWFVSFRQRSKYTGKMLVIKLHINPEELIMKTRMTTSSVGGQINIAFSMRSSWSNGSQSYQKMQNTDLIINWLLQNKNKRWGLLLINPFPVRALLISIWNCESNLNISPTNGLQWQFDKEDGVLSWFGFPAQSKKVLSSLSTGELVPDSSGKDKTPICAPASHGK